MWQFGDWFAEKKKNSRTILWTLARSRALMLLQPDKTEVSMKDNMSIIRQVIELETKSPAEIRAIYNNLFQDRCLSNAKKEYLRPKRAYRLQELALGGLDKQTKSKLESIAKNGAVITKTKHSDLLAGTKICREYNGVDHQVEVTKDGFEYSGQKWNSLSAIATKITGTKWNGPRFFGLRV